MIAKRHLVTAAAALTLLSWVPCAWGQPGSTVTGTVIASDVNLREGPGRDREAIAALDEGAKVTVLTRKGEWARIRTKKGTTGWTLAEFVRTSRPTALHSKADTSAPLVAHIHTVPAAPAATPAAAGEPAVPPAETAASQPQTANSTASAPVTATPAGPAPTGALAGTRSDPAPTTQDSPAAAVGNASHFLFYLVPVLALIVLGIRGLKSLQQRTGASGPIAAQGLKLNIGTRSRSVNSIRVVESARVGAATVYLVDARGRQLLLGTSGSSIHLLANLSSNEPAGNEEFREILNEAAVEMRDSHASDNLTSILGALDGRMRQTSDSVNKSASRVRHWTEM